jgi:hypothetical protein
MLLLVHFPPPPVVVPSGCESKYSADGVGRDSKLPGYFDWEDTIGVHAFGRRAGTRGVGRVDSLISIELKNWNRQRIAVEVSVREIMGAVSVIQLGVLVQGKLLEKMRR